MPRESEESVAASAQVMDSIAQTSAPTGEDLSLRKAIRVLSKRKHIVLWVVLACTALTLAASLLLPGYYSSTATVEIEQSQENPLEGALGQLGSSIGGLDDVKTEVETEVNVLQSDVLGVETMERMKFEDKHRGWLRHSKRIPSERGVPLRDAADMREYLLKKFEDRLTVNMIPNSRLIQVSFEDPDAKFATDTVNTLIDQYIKDSLSRRNASTTLASEWMATQIADLKKQVQASQERLINYQRQSGLFASSFSNSAQPGQPAQAPVVQSPVLDRFMQLNQDLVTAQAARIAKEAVYRIAKSGDPRVLANMADEAQAASPGDQAQAGMFAGLQLLRTQQVALNINLAAAIRTYGPKNPKIIDVNRELEQLDKEIAREVNRIIERTELDYQVAKSAEDGIQKAYNSANIEANKVNDSQIRLAVLQQEADSTRMLYEDLFTKLQESELAEGIKDSNVNVISDGLVPGKPEHPKPLLDTVLGFVAGIFIGVIVVFVLDNLDDALFTDIQVEEIAGIPVLGAIVQFDSAPASVSKKEDENLDEKGSRTRRSKPDPNSQAAEGYRSLRTTLLLSQAGTPPRTMLFTSSLPSEGKSTTTYNLAVSFAALGKKVLALDADLRRPTLHLFTDSTNEQGLSNLLTSSMKPEDVILKDPVVENLSLLPAGPIPPNPAELLGSPAFSSLMDSLSTQFDFILLDSAPAMLVTDSIITAAKVDGVVLVVRSGSSTKMALHRVTENLRRNKANLLGVVLNGVNEKSQEYYYAYGYRGGVYGGEYYDNDKK